MTAILFLSSLPMLVQAAMPDPAHRFAPPLDAEWRYRIEETREQAGQVDRYRLDRTVRFTREGGGYHAVLTATAVDGGIASGPGAMFEAGISGLVGTPIHMHLDSSGRVTAIDDLDGHFDRWTAGIIGGVQRGLNAEKRGAVARALTDRFAAMPGPARLEIFASMLGTIIATPDLPAAPTAPGPVTQRGPGFDLTGTRRAFRDPGGRLMVEERLSGRGDAPGGPVAVTMDHSRAIDPETGLIRASMRVRRTSSGDAVQTITTRMTVDPPTP